MPCLICFAAYDEKVNKPLILPCGHDLCNVCILGLYKQKNNTAIECPQCRIVHRIDPKTLPVVFSLINKTDQSRTSPNCNKPNCKEKTFKFCNHCSHNLCSVHYAEDREEIKRLVYASLQVANQKIGEMNHRMAAIEQEKNSTNLGFENLEINLTNYIKMLKNKKEQVAQKKQEALKKLASTSTEIWEKQKLITVAATDLELLSEIDNNDLAAMLKQLDLTMKTRAGVVHVSQFPFNWESLRDEFNSFVGQFNVGTLETTVDTILNVPHTMLHGQGQVSTEISVEDMFEAKNMTIVSLTFKPLDITVCTNTNGFNIDINGKVVQQSTLLGNISGRQILPCVCYFVSMWDNDSKLCVLSSSGVLLGSVELQLNRQEPSLQGLACSSVLQKLYLSDIDNSCIHVTDLAGRCQATIGGSDDFDEIRGICIDERDNQMKLYACEAERNEVLVFSLVDHTFLQKIKHSSLHEPQYVSVNTFNNQLWVINFQSNIISSFKLEDINSCTLVNSDDKCKLAFAWGIVHSDNGNAYVTSHHCVSKISSDGISVKSLGQVDKQGSQPEDFSLPTGICFFKHQGQKKLLVCDKNNSRIKLYHL